MGNFGAPDLGLDNLVTGNTVANTVAAPKQEQLSNMTYRGVGLPLDPNRPFNPPAHPRAWGTSPGGMGRKRAPQLLRGRISMWGVEKGDLPGASRRRSRSLNFLYNPNTITHSYSIDPSSIPQESRTSEDQTTPNLVSGQSIAWKLYFNRQYDVADPRGDPDRKHGVLADTQALERVLGVHRPGEGFASSRVIVVFGIAPSSQPYLAANNPMSAGSPFGFVGWITGLTINYLMFNHRMIPTVAEVDIQMSRLLVPDVVAEAKERQTNRYTNVDPTALATGVFGNRPRSAAPGGSGPAKKDQQAADLLNNMYGPNG